MAAIPPSKAWTFTRVADSVGSVGAMLCAVHCALLPLVIAALPALGISVLASTSLEWGFVMFATILAVTSLWQGYLKHRVYRALAFLVPGLLAVWSGVLIPDLHHSVVPHAIVMTMGGTLIAVAHIINLRLTHGHVHDAGCHHH
ncbi:MAG: MerC domain-containing protein [Arenimonas sp.]